MKTTQKPGKTPRKPTETHYEIALSADLSTLLGSSCAFLNDVNDTLKEFGCQERLCARANLLALNLTSPRELTANDKKVITLTIEETFGRDKDTKSWRVKVEGFKKK